MVNSLQGHIVQHHKQMDGHLAHLCQLFGVPSLVLSIRPTCPGRHELLDKAQTVG